MNLERRLNRLEEMGQSAKPRNPLLVVYKDENVEKKIARYRQENGCDPAMILRSCFTTVERGIKNEKGN